MIFNRGMGKQTVIHTENEYYSAIKRKPVMKKHGGNLHAYEYMKRANLKR